METYGQRDAAREIKLANKLKALCLKICFVPFCLKSVGSTQDYLSKIPNAKEGYFVVSEMQTSGRGRQGREWVSDLGGLYLSLMLQPKTQEDLARLTGLCAVSVVETLLENSLECKIKEPNDVLCNGRKIAGVLVDATVQGGMNVALCGIGVNVNNGTDWSKEMLNLATSVKIQRKGLRGEIDIDGVLISLIANLERNYVK